VPSNRRRIPAASFGVAIVLAAAGAGSVSLSSQAPNGLPAVSFDMVVADREGRVPDSLGPADVTVSVDGKPRRVVAIRRVTRGPGALSDASARLARSAAGGAFAAEPSRNVVVVIDESGVVRGQERQAIEAGRAFLDRLGMADRMATLQLPMAGNQLLSLTTDQPVVREALAGITGRILPSVPSRTELVPIEPDPAVVNDPNREPGTAPVVVAQPAPTPIDMSQPARHGNLEGLAGVLDAMRPAPGRKVIALFSAGVIDPVPAQFTGLAAGAVAARTAIYVFGLSAPSDGLRADPETGPLETLATSTGGRFVALGRNPERAVGRIVGELASCYVVEVEGAATDADGKRHALRVDVANRTWSARAPAWLVPTPDAGDVAAAGPEPADSAGSAPASGGDGGKPPRAKAGVSEREAELQLALGRLIDYVEAYERQYSGLVAEEEYNQSASRGTVRMRSDFLLVKPEQSAEWVSFRDVYEVDGVAVRDRDDRLRRLFLEPGALAEGQLMAIRTESARYNVGAVERNINVPLFLLRFLAPEIRGRFKFKAGGLHQSGGIDVWRIEFTEIDRPTIITDLRGRDVPAKGWFLVDQLTGAIVESGLHIEENGSTGVITVSFRHDPELGMWVPARMSEVYRTMVQRALSGPPRMETVTEGTATYRKFRRFQVKTEETIIIPK
jgi:VWFA-related protein